MIHPEKRLKECHKRTKTMAGKLKNGMGHYCFRHFIHMKYDETVILTPKVVVEVPEVPSSFFPVTHFGNQESWRFGGA